MKAPREVKSIGASLAIPDGDTVEHINRNMEILLESEPHERIVVGLWTLFHAVLSETLKYAFIDNGSASDFDAFHVGLKRGSAKMIEIMESQIPAKEEGNVP